MNYILSIQKIDVFEYPFIHPIIFKDKTYLHTNFSRYEFSFKEKASNSLVFKNSLCVNLLPLFWNKDNYEFSYPKNIEIELSHLDITKSFYNLCSDQVMPNNYKFTLELALFNFLLFKKLNPYQDFFQTSKSIKTAILMNSNNQDLSITDKFIKLKIGINSLARDKEVIKTLSEKNTLRLDANQSLTPIQLEDLLRDINPAAIDSIEEPFLDINKWCEFKYKDKYFLAVDESLDKDLSKLEGRIKYYVLKPSYNITISGIFDLLTKIKFKTSNALISSSYEYEDAFNFLISLASFCNHTGENHSTIHGLGTYQVMNQMKFIDQNPVNEAIKLRSFLIL